MTEVDQPALALPRVSDHALVRYMERIKGICLDAYRAEIQALAAANQHRPLPAAGEFDDGLILVIEVLGLPVVTTVLGPGQRPKRRRAFGTQLIHVPPNTEPPA